MEHRSSREGWKQGNSSWTQRREKGGTWRREAKKSEGSKKRKIGTDKGEIGRMPSQGGRKV
jgi:hypothetical protein